MWGRQTSITPSVIPIGPIYVKDEAGYVRRRVVLDVAIAKRGLLRADQQPLRRIIGTVRAMGEACDKRSGLGLVFYQQPPRLLAARWGCLI